MTIRRKNIKYKTRNAVATPGRRSWEMKKSTVAGLSDQSTRGNQGLLVPTTNALDDDIGDKTSAACKN